MEEALKRFQARHGLNQDGLIGPATLAQLNVSPRERAEQIAVNLERLRWLNGQLGERYILVNQAGFEMQVIEHGRPVFASRVIVGESGEHETPEFSEMMTHMIVNPSWHVPMSIARNEILPKLKQDPTYLAKQGMRLVGAGADAEQIDWANITPASFPGRITQSPGDENALGSVKFMFPNRYSVYLHDTPTKRLFERDIRDFSHGCVRVERPHEFAEYLLTGQVSDPGSYFDTVLAQGRERRIDLERPLPVHLTYRSAWIDENGVEQFRGDIYDRDAKIAAALEAAGVRILADSRVLTAACAARLDPPALAPRAAPAYRRARPIHVRASPMSYTVDAIARATGLDPARRRLARGARRLPSPPPPARTIWRSP